MGRRYAELPIIRSALSIAPTRDRSVGRAAVVRSGTSNTTSGAGLHNDGSGTEEVVLVSSADSSSQPGEAAPAYICRTEQSDLGIDALVISSCAGARRRTAL